MMIEERNSSSDAVVIKRWTKYSIQIFLSHGKRRRKKYDANIEVIPAYLFVQTSASKLASDTTHTIETVEQLKLKNDFCKPRSQNFS